MVDTTEILRMSGVDPRKCMRCGKCTATCPSYNEMDIPPHRFVYLVEQGRVETLLSCQTIWKCLSCFACVERCPRGVEPAKLIEALRLTKLRPQGGDRLQPAQLADIEDDDLPQQALVSALRKFSK